MKYIRTLLISLLLVPNLALADNAPDLNDPEVRKKLFEEAAGVLTLDIRRTGEDTALYYHKGTETPYTGWVSLVTGKGKEASLGYVKNGKDDGPNIALHENGQRAAAGRYSDGKPEGLWTTWHENGQKSSECTFQNGRVVGAFTKWHENGRKWVAGTYRDGKEEGLWTWWDETGKTTKQVRYRSGEEVDGSSSASPRGPAPASPGPSPRKRRGSPGN